MTAERILIIEDTQMNMELATDLLEVAGYKVLQAETAETGIEMARTEAPDLILMDIGLPRMDGLTATGILRQDPLTKDIPIIALTSHAMKGDRKRTMAAGCSGYITKPIDTREFPKLVGHFLESSARGRR
ncbi:MAG: response regulator [Candidatus Marinimicrobia bacterium]|nr:response regulator [Candidatus Neomarinimicrobiota bacterium]